MLLQPHRNFVTLFLLFFYFEASSQFANKDYSRIDSLAIRIVYNDVNQLAIELTQNYKDDLSKIRSIYTWVTENINYDYKVLTEEHPFSKFIKNGKSINENDFNNDVILDALTTKKAVCYGYACLFKKLCELSAVKCEIIQGKARVLRNLANENYQGDGHAWNAVQINNQWYLLDATWGVASEVNIFNQNIKIKDDFYFLADPLKLIYTHFPSNSKWQLNIKPITMDEFLNQPLLLKEYFKFNINSLEPFSNVITVKKSNKFIHIKFDLERDHLGVNVVEYNKNLDNTKIDKTNNLSLIKEKKGKKLTIRKQLKFGTQRVDVYFDNKLAMSYKVEWINQ
jgi:transglutaminase/protease-like cytokinesis protein 3